MFKSSQKRILEGLFWFSVASTRARKLLAPRVGLCGVRECECEFRFYNSYV
jgi:hypothetical protein